MSVSADVVDLQRKIDDRLRDIVEPFAVRAGMLSQQVERPIDRDVVRVRGHALRLLDHDAAVERPLQLRTRAFDPLELGCVEHVARRHVGEQACRAQIVRRPRAWSHVVEVEAADAGGARTKWHRGRGPEADPIERRVQVRPPRLGREVTGTDDRPALERVDAGSFLQHLLLALDNDECRRRRGRESKRAAVVGEGDAGTREMERRGGVITELEERVRQLEVNLVASR